MDIADARSIAVVRTRLPYIDRRSLSQAWFSALHVASDGPPKLGNARRPDSAVAARTHATRVPAPARNAPPAIARGKTPLRPAAPERTGGGSEVAARRTQRLRALPATARPPAFGDERSYAPFQTSLSVGIEGARVALLLRRDGPVLHVVALCAPANVELVRRALACADAHLRRSGDSVRASVRATAEVRA